MSRLPVKSKARVNWAYDKFYMMIKRSTINRKSDFIEDYPCDEEELKNKKK